MPPTDSLAETGPKPPLWSDDQQIGRFRIVRKLGAGGMGVVYEAIDTERGGRVALKTLKSIEPQAARRFKNEFRALSDLRHPNVIELYELHATEHRLYFTMRLVDGCDWLSWVRDSEMSAGWSRDESQIRDTPDYDRIRAALRQLTLGLAAIHGIGKVHRDVKPANVLVEPDGHVVLLDFGLVRDTDTNEINRMTASGAVVGTPAFMSPEQARGLELTPASDWYAVGVILFQALTHKLPYPGASSRQLETRGPPPDPRESLRNTPAPLAELCMALMDPDPAKRPTAEDILAILPEGEGRPTPAADRARRPFVARGAAVTQLTEAYNAATLGRTVVTFIEGPSGIGKTALSDHFLRGLRRRDGNGVVILRGRCYEQESVPYKALDPLIDRLTSYLHRLSAADVAALLPREIHALTRLFPTLLDVEMIDLAPRRSPTDEQELRQRAFDALRELLGRITDRRPLVLSIDDLQWTDDDSVSLLLHLLRPPEAPHLLLLGSFRGDEATETNNPLGRLVSELDKPRSGVDVRRVSLGPLPALDTSLLAEALLTELGLPPGLADRIAEESEGNPLLAGELVRHLASGQEGDEPEAIGSPRLSTMLAERTQRLPRSARRLLETVAIAGRRLPLSVALSAATPNSGEDDPVGRLRVERFVRTAGPRKSRTIETYHDRIRVVTVEQMADEDRRRTHEALARALRQTADPDPDHLLEHYRAAGDDKRAGEFAILAAERAATQLAFDRAADRFELALRLGAGDRAKLETRLGESLANCGRAQDAAEAYLRAAELEDGNVRIDLKRRGAMLLLESGHSERGKSELADVLRAHNLKLPASRRSIIVALLMRRAKLKLRGLSWTEDRDVDAKTLARLDTCWSASRGLTITDLYAGGYFQAEHLLLALSSGDPSRVALALAEEAKSSSYFGDRGVARARKLLGQVQELAERLGTPHARALAIATEALVLLMGAQWADSLELNQQAETLLRDECTGVHQEIFDTMAGQAAALYVMGDLVGLDVLCSRTAAETGIRKNIYHEVLARSFLVLPALGRADVSNARDTLAAMTPLATERGIQAAGIQLVNAQAAFDIYTDAAPDTWDTRQAAIAGMSDNPLMRASLARTEVWSWHGRLALAAAERRQDRREELLGHAQRLARSLAKDPFPTAKPFAGLLRAGIDHLRGRTDATEGQLRRAAEQFDALDMKVYAAASRRRLGRVLGGDRGSLMCERAEAVMRSVGGKNFDAFTRIWAPGFPD